MLCFFFFWQVLRSLVVEVLQDKPSEKILFRIWREGQQRADAAAADNASFEMEEDQVRYFAPAGWAEGATRETGTDGATATNERKARSRRPQVAALRETE